MTELDSESRALIALARGAEDGDLADRARVKRRISAALGGAVIAATARETLDSGIQTSAPLADSATGGLVERVSGEVLRAAPAVNSAAAFGGISAVFVQAAALLLGGAIAGGTAWFALGGRSDDVANGASSTPITASAAVVLRGGDKIPPTSMSPTPAPALVRGDQKPSRDHARPSALVSQPEPVLAEPPIQLEDLPVLEPTASPKRSPKRAPSRRPSTGSNEGPGLSLADEARDLAAVHEALRQGNHALALARLDAMDRRLGGLLREERSVARVLSLCGLGRVAEAESIARRVESVSPESPLLPRLRSSCAKGTSSKTSP